MSNPAPTNTESTVDPGEIEKFAAMAAEWWDPTGKFKPLHKLNPCRLAFIRDQICGHFDVNPLGSKPLKGLRILDIGCGGGLLCEPLTRLGATMLGADMAEINTQIARNHAESQGLEIDYRHTSAEALAEQGEQFDVVMAMEIIEHVADVELFLECCSSMVKPGGLLLLSTINRTAKAHALAVIAAEYILRWVPIGTHDPKKFVTPEEIRDGLPEEGFEMQQPVGFTYNPLADRWKLSSDVSVNYAVAVRRET